MNATPEPVPTPGPVAVPPMPTAPTPDAPAATTTTAPSPAPVPAAEPSIPAPTANEAPAPPDLPEAVVPRVPSAPGSAVVTDVRGGAGSIRAQYDELERLAIYNSNTTTNLMLSSAGAATVLANPALGLLRPLDPVGSVKATAALGEALASLGKLTTTIGRRTAQLRTASAAYRATDLANAAALQYFDGMLTPFVLAPTVGALLSSTPLLIASPELRESTLTNAMELLAEHPGVVDHLGRGLVPLLQPFSPASVRATDKSNLLTLLYPDGPGYLRKADTYEKEAPIILPNSVAHLMKALDNANTSKGPGKGQLQVQVIRNSDGTVRSAIVNIPGTDNWEFTPWTINEKKSINDLPTNIQALAGNTTSYERMVAEALRESGVSTGPGGPPVMLVGHSQGGIVAANAAGKSDYNITHVVTAGSPVGSIGIPHNVQMLSLENDSDVVPHLDSADNPNLANRTTVTFDIPSQTDVGKAHAIRHAYIPAAEALAEVQDRPSVAQFVNSADRFLGAPQDASTSIYQYWASREDK